MKKKHIVKTPRELARLVAELTKYKTFAEYIEKNKDAKDAEIYSMTRVARLIGWNVAIRKNVIYENSTPLYILK